jgi:hypothetical protein
MKTFETLIPGLLVLSLGLFSSGALASGQERAPDPANGEKLVTQNCTRCHDDSVYTRPNRRVKTLPGLGKQVRFCKDNLGITWFDDEVNDVIYFLNDRYYHF